MALQYLAGQRLTADALQRAVPDRVEQAADQSVTSSVTPVDSAIAITVDGLPKIDLEVRYTSGGGGIRWIWDADAGVTFLSRSVGASGSDRQSFVSGRSGSVRVDLGGRRIIKKK